MSASPEVSKHKLYEELKKLEDHFALKRSQIYYRSEFYRCIHKPQMSVAEYMSRLSDTTATRNEYSFTVRTSRMDPITVDVLMHDVSVKMEQDTGSSVSTVIGDNSFTLSFQSFRRVINTFKDLFRLLQSFTSLLVLFRTPIRKKFKMNYKAPIVPVMKSDKVIVRVCGDYSVTVNKASKLESYPIAKLDDLTLPLLVACDALQYGVGTVLAHCFQDGTETPIAFASRTLSDTEKKYSQFEN
uniref:Reverse transcriptase/retrotransposon-derived protein RNase H-like domain-containing protein n=1 Tax=Amphimedon queenslandica TaxID=400682 RepID=A0A1X7VIG8_AMPQE